MQFLGEFISIGVAFSWTDTAILCEYAGKRLGSITFNFYRMIFTIAFSFVLFWVVLGNPLPASASDRAYVWMLLSGVVGFVICDYNLMKCYTIIGSRFGQLFMTISPLSAAVAAWMLLGQSLKPMAIVAMLVTLAGISLSIIGRGDKHMFSLKLPAKGVFHASVAAICQGIGLVISKVGLDYYQESIPRDILDHAPWILPFCANFYRCIAGFIGFGILVALNRNASALKAGVARPRVVASVVSATIFGPFVGVAFSLMAVQYTAAGIASTLMALSPIMILVPAHFWMNQRVTWKGGLGALISVLGVALFFMG